MSKKIIYLLSLLMALSLVFASCKKNSATDALGGAPVDVPDPITPPSGLDGDGLYTSWDELAKKNEEPVQRTAVWKYNGDYSRNPVVVALGEKTNAVLIISEKRYKKPGSANDIGVDGSTVVDIQWASSINSGVSFDTGDYKSGVIHTAGNNADNAHGAPVVFKVDAKTVVVVASAGAAISRTDQPYSDRKAAGKGSRIEYTIGTMDASGNMTWNQWKKIGGIEGVVGTIASANGSMFEQFGTHSARGFTTSSDKTMLLAVVMAIQGVNGEQNYKEFMGYLLVTGQLQGDDVKWTVGQKESAYAFEKGGNQYSKHKEARIIGGTAQSPKYLVVPNGRATLQLAVGDGFKSAPSYSIAGADGSIGSVTVDKWFGTGKYNPAKLDDSSYTTGSRQDLLMHVANIEANLKIYLMENGFTGQKANTVPYSITSEAKSSSIDVLGDGTIVTAAEEGLANSSIERSYVINFTRYTQYFLATQTGNK